MAHKKNKPKYEKPAEQKSPKEYLGVPDPNPDTPDGMAFLFSAGICDPRPGGYPERVYPNQQWALIQSWVPTSKMWWDFGIRYHPELATKWVKGGGQFGLAEIVDKPPPPPKSIEELAGDFADDQFGGLKAEVERVRDHGTDAEKASLRRQFEQSQQQINALVEAFDTEKMKEQ